MKKRRERRAPAVDARDFPALREFLRGYLHEDFPDEFGSAVGAAAAFLRDASAEELSSVRAEAFRLRQLTAGTSLHEARRLFSEGFGCAWRVGSPAEVEALLAVLLGEPREGEGP